MSDPAERYYSPPPPSGLRERLVARKRSLIAAAIFVLAVVAVFAIARVVSGDGKNSGHLERAFGGNISVNDKQRLADIAWARDGANGSYIGLIQGMRNRDLDAALDATNEGQRLTESALGAAGAIENERLRSGISRVLETQHEVFAAYGRVLTYAREHRFTPKARMLLRTAARAEVAAREASADFYRTVSPYMTPEQRREFSKQQSVWRSRVQEAGG